jgi:hypothetical protein
VTPTTTKNFNKLVFRKSDRDINDSQKLSSLRKKSTFRTPKKQIEDNSSDIESTTAIDPPYELEDKVVDY